VAVSIDSIGRPMASDRPPVRGGSSAASPSEQGPAEEEPDGEREGERASVDVAIHRTDVVRRLLELGVTVRALEALLPGWERPISEALDQLDEDRA
jgi:hypothetical protein